MIHVWQLLFVVLVFGLFVVAGYVLKKLQGGDGPFGHVDRGVAPNHFWSRWF